MLSWYRIRLAAVAALAVAVATALLVLDVPELLDGVMGWVDGFSAAAPLMFILVYTVITVLLLPGIVLMLGAGALFGLVQGTLYSSIGATLGATAAFLIGRYLLQGWIARHTARSPRLQAIDAIVSSRGGRIVFLLRMSPIIPYNISNYLYALSRIKLLPYIAGSWLGMLPICAVYVYIGSLLRDISAAASAQQTRSPLEWGLYALGFAATLLVTLYISHLARRALQEAAVAEHEQL